MDMTLRHPGPESGKPMLGSKSLNRIDGAGCLFGRENFSRRPKRQISASQNDERPDRLEKPEHPGQQESIGDAFNGRKSGVEQNLIL